MDDDQTSKPSASWTYRANPNWYRASEGLPYLEGIDYALNPGAHGRRGAVQGQAPLGPADAESGQRANRIKRENPEALLVPADADQGNGSYRAALRPSSVPDSPLMDIRVLQAASMLIDRDALNDVFGNVSNLGKQGLEVESVWHSHTPASWAGIWLDPKAGKLGPDSKLVPAQP